MKRLIQHYLNRVRSTESEQDYVDGIVNKGLSLIELLFPQSTQGWLNRIHKHNQCLAAGDIQAFEQHERYLRVMHFGHNVPYWAYVELPLSSVKHGQADDVWMHYAYLQQVKADFNLSRDYFRQKVLYHAPELKRKKQYKNKPKVILHSHHHLRDLNLLDRYVNHMEIKAIKKKVEKRFDRWIYTHSKIEAAMDVLLSYLPNECDASASDMAKPVIPLSIEWELIEADMLSCVKVEWGHGLTEVSKLHKFQETECIENVIQAFAVTLYESGVAYVDKGKDSGANVDKYLRRLGMQGLFKRLFIEIEGNEVRLKNKKISLASLPINDLDELSLFLGGLEFIRWEFKKLLK